MTVTQPLSRIRFTEREVLRYRRDVEDGSREFEASAPEEWAWDEVLAKANFLFDRIIDLDLDLQELVLSERIEFDPALDAKVRGLLRDWLDVSLRVIPRVEGRAVGGVDVLRGHIAEARSMLTPDGEFFAGGGLARLRDAALDEHRAGRTERFDVDGLPE